MIQSVEIQDKIRHWRQKQAEGRMTTEDYKEALLILRESRRQAQNVSQASRTKKANAAPVNTAALKDSLKMLRKP